MKPILFLLSFPKVCCKVYSHCRGWLRRCIRDVTSFAGFVSVAHWHKKAFSPEYPAQRQFCLTSFYAPSHGCLFLCLTLLYFSLSQKAEVSGVSEEQVPRVAQVSPGRAGCLPFISQTISLWSWGSFFLSPSSLAESVITDFKHLWGGNHFPSVCSAGTRSLCSSPDTVGGSSATAGLWSLLAQKQTLMLNPCQTLCLKLAKKLECFSWLNQFSMSTNISL